MKYLLQLTLSILLLTTCHSGLQFTPHENRFFKTYEIGDTLFFFSSENERDTFTVIRIDSLLRTGLGFFGNQIQNDKNIFIRQLPIDTTHGSTEAHIKAYRLDHKQFLGAHKRPKENTLSYSIRLKEFEAFSEKFGLLSDSISVMGKTFKNCYTLRNSNINSDSSGTTISHIYWTIDSGMVAYKQFNGTEWFCTRSRK